MESKEYILLFAMFTDILIFLFILLLTVLSTCSIG